jgi:hypothetical protein
LKRCEPAGGRFIKKIQEDIFNPVLDKILKDLMIDSVVLLSICIECTLAFMPSNVSQLTEEHIDNVTNLYPGDFTEDELRSCKNSLETFKTIVTLVVTLVVTLRPHDFLIQCWCHFYTHYTMSG